MNIYNKQKDLKLSGPKIKAIVKATLKFLKVDCLGLDLHFVTKPKIISLHKKFFNDPTLTDCITLPCDLDDSEHRFLGEAFICPYTAKAYTNKYGGDPYDEVTLYIIHTLLHMLGWEDTTPTKRKKMFEEQDRILDHLRTKRLSLKTNIK